MVSLLWLLASCQRRDRADQEAEREHDSAKSRWLRSLAKSIGPGVITGAADDNPSGIATYSVAGAQLGTSLHWTALLTWPLMAAVSSAYSMLRKTL